MTREKTRYFEAAASGSTNHHRLPGRVEFGQAIGDLAHGDVQEVGRHRRERRLPVLANIQKRHFAPAGAPVHEFPGGHVLDHQNTNFWAAVALISGATTVSNRLSRIHSLLSTRRTRMASMTGAAPTIANKRPPTRSDFSKRVS